MTRLRVGCAVAIIAVTAIIPLARGDQDHGRAFKAKNESDRRLESIEARLRLGSTVRIRLG